VKARPLDLTAAIVGHGFLRIASGASAVLIGIYLARLSSSDIRINAGLIGMLGAVSYASELVASIPFGLAADAISPRWLMVGGALTGAVAVRIFALAPHPGIFYFSRALEGVGVAAVTPPLLAYLAQSTAHSSSLRARVMSFFELSLLAGLALGGVVGSQLWTHLHLHSFSLLALVYAACALLLFAGAKGTRAHGSKAAVHGLKQALRSPEIRSLAPVWLCVNAIVGLWLGPTTTFLLTQKQTTSQYLDGVFAADPTHVGWMLLGYSAVFGVGVLSWSFVLPHLPVRSAMRISLIAMPFVCVGLYAINHSAGWSATMRMVVLAMTSLIVMIESGFTPAALAWLAKSLIGSDGKGVAMGIYSVLLGIGAIAGSLLAGWLGNTLRFDGLLLGTMILAVISLFLLHGVADDGSQQGEESYERAGI
jgi:MFS family permease